MSASNAIEIDNLTVQFDGKSVLSGFSMRLESGQKATLTGRSGSGKSTVLRCILGFLVPDEGVIRVDGEELSAGSIWRLRTRMAYVAQEPLLGSGTVREILERPFSYRANAHMKENLARVPDLFDRFMLPSELLDKNIDKLSGGEKQRVAIISAEILGRSIYLLDEVSSALDKVSRQAVNEFFCAREDLSVLSISHESEQFFCADQIIDVQDASRGGRK